MRLAWKQNGAGWLARSVDGSAARIYPDPSGERDVYVMEADLGDKTYWGGADLAEVVSNSRSPARTRLKILDGLKGQLEGYLLRFDTTGVQDPIGANETILKMDGQAWRVLLSRWEARNRANDVGASTVSANDAAATEQRSVHRGFQIDTNRINARGGQLHMNRLERWNDDGVIEVIISETAATEAARGGALQARKAMSYVQSQTLATTEPEAVTMRKIEMAIFPGGAKSSSERNDVEIVFNAEKYSRILVTTDGGSKRQPGGILGARKKLAALGITVMTDAEACAYVEGLVAARDERARQAAREAGTVLPQWVGRD
jgi:hypothetical protein